MNQVKFFFAFVLLFHEFASVKGQPGESPYAFINISKSSATNTVINAPLYDFADVDAPIQKKTTVNYNRFALIIGNENYSPYGLGLTNAEFAVHDADIFRLYAVGVLGVPEQNVFFRTDATTGILTGLIQRFTSAVNLSANIPEVFVYYSGHGMPGNIEGDSFLLPVDADLVSMNGAVKLSVLMSDIALTKASKIIYFVDACFTGAGRNGNVLASSRGIRFVVSPKAIPEKTVVFTAGTAVQPALAFPQTSHGLFTYFLLSELRNNEKGVRLQKFSEDIYKNVSTTSLRLSGTLQNPSVRSGIDIQTEWQTWIIK